MLFMVIEHFRDGDALVGVPPVPRRGPRRAGGLELRRTRGSRPSLERCFQLMETDDVGLLQQWVAFWADLVEFEIVPVTASKDAYAALEPKL